MRRLAELATANEKTEEFSNLIKARQKKCHQDPDSEIETFHLSPSTLSFLRDIAKQSKDKNYREKTFFKISQVFSGDGRPVQVDLQTGVATVDYEFTLFDQKVKVKEVFSRDPANELILLGQFQSNWQRLQDKDAPNFGVQIPGYNLAKKAILGIKPRSKDYREAIRGDLTIFATGQISRDAFITGRVKSDSPIQQWLEDKVANRDEPSIVFQVAFVRKASEGKYVSLSFAKEVSSGEETEHSVTFAKAWGNILGEAESVKLRLSDTKSLSLQYEKTTMSEKSGRLSGYNLGVTRNAAEGQYFKQLSPTTTLILETTRSKDEEVYATVLNFLGGAIAVGIEKEAGEKIRGLIETGIKW